MECTQCGDRDFLFTLDSEILREVLPCALCADHWKQLMEEDCRSFTTRQRLQDVGLISKSSDQSLVWRKDQVEASKHSDLPAVTPRRG